MSPHRKSHNLLYNLLREKNKPPQEMVNKRGVPIGPTWLIRTLGVGFKLRRITDHFKLVLKRCNSLGGHGDSLVKEPVDLQRRGL